jgi:hypothetical protein
MESQRTSLRSPESARTRSEFKLFNEFNDINGFRYALDVIRECGEAWDKLMKGQTQKGNLSL